MNKLFDSILTNPTTPSEAGIIVAAAVILGLLISLAYIFTNKRMGYSSTLALSTVLLPPILAMLIFFIGNNAAGALSVLGGFSLVRFRSVPADPKDLSYIFLSLACGVGCGMGYIGYAVLLAVVVIVVMFLLNVTKYAAPRPTMIKLKITVPEDLNFGGLFDDIFEKYTTSYRLHRIKTREFGSLFELAYTINMNSKANPKDMIDEIRCRNGNLEVSYVVSQFADKIYDD